MVINKFHFLIKQATRDERENCMTNAIIIIANNYVFNKYNKLRHRLHSKISLTWQTDHLYLLTSKSILKKMGISQMST